MQSLYFAMSEPPCKLRRLCARSFDKDDDGPDLTDIINCESSEELSEGDETPSMSVVSVDSSKSGAASLYQSFLDGAACGSTLLQPVGNSGNSSNYNLEDDCRIPWKLSPQHCSLAHLDIDDLDESECDYVPTPVSEQACEIHECHTNPYATPAKPGGRYVLIGPLPHQGNADAGAGPEPSERDETDGYDSDLSESHLAQIHTGHGHPRDDDDDDDDDGDHERDDDDYDSVDDDGPTDEDIFGPSHSMAIVPHTDTDSFGIEPPSGEPLPPGSSSGYPIIPVTISIDGVFHLRLGPNPIVQHKHVRAKCDFYHRS